MTGQEKKDLDTRTRERVRELKNVYVSIFSEFFEMQAKNKVLNSNFEIRKETKEQTFVKSTGAKYCTLKVCISGFFRVLSKLKFKFFEFSVKLVVQIPLHR